MGSFDAEEVRDRLDAVLRPFDRQAISDNLLRSIRNVVVGLLLEMREKDELPKAVPVTMKTVLIQQNGSCLNIVLPMKFRAWMELGDDAFRPHYAHDCSHCIFLAHALKHDHYYCPRSIPKPTVIARASSVPSDYQSGIDVAWRLPEDVPLGVAYRLAVDEGLIERSEG